MQGRKQPGPRLRAQSDFKFASSRSTVALLTTSQATVSQEARAGPGRRRCQAAQEQVPPAEPGNLKANFEL